jgi:hypothetical protein
MLKCDVVMGAFRGRYTSTNEQAKALDPVNGQFGGQTFLADRFRKNWRSWLFTSAKALGKMPAWQTRCWDRFMKPVAKRAGITGRVPYLQTYVVSAVIWAGWIANSLSRAHPWIYPI